MKKVFMLFFSLFLSATMLVNAQEDKSTGDKIKTGAKKTGSAIKSGAKKVGNKTAELASKGSSKVVDRTYDGKTAPNGRTVYITEDSKYYWVNKKGRRVYVTEDQLKDKQ
ncbi:MAG TPA: hypothetical protein VF610_05905 [Segetibacter sp.]|jgi:hypothetical protein